jgi:hypothetical protein
MMPCKQYDTFRHHSHSRREVLGKQETLSPLSRRFDERDDNKSLVDIVLRPLQ